MDRSEESEDITEVKFHRDIKLDEAGELFRYVTYHLPGKTAIQLHTQYSEMFGSQYEEPCSPPSNLPEKIYNEKLTGIVMRAPFRSAFFELRSKFVEMEDGNDLRVFSRLSFNVTPGYKLGELSSDDKKIMIDTRRAIEKYFADFQI
jgi:hypothetical protein